MFLKRVITSLVYEICEFFAKRYSIFTTVI